MPGRLHRLHTDKRDVRIYDYVDINAPMLERMYYKRLKGYAAIGYQVSSDSADMAVSREIIYDQNQFSIYIPERPFTGTGEYIYRQPICVCASHPLVGESAL